MSGKTSFRSILKWMAALVLVLAAAGGGALYWLYRQADEKLLEVILQKQRQLAPDWDVTIRRARFDWDRHITIYDVAIKARGQATAVLELPQVVITIDGEKFRETEQIDIRQVRLVGPRASLVRDREGRWNWHKLLTLKPTERPCPEWIVEQGEADVRLEQSDGSPPARILLQALDCKLIPAAKRRFLVAGDARVNEAGTVSVQGRWHLDERKWWLDGKLERVAGGDELLRLIAGTSAELRTRLARVDAALKQMTAEAGIAENPRPQPLATADASTATSADAGDRVPEDAGGEPLAAPANVPDFGLRSMLDVAFHIGQEQPGAEPDFRAALRLSGGQIANAVLPFVLRDLAGEVYWDNRQVVLRGLEARNGTTRVRVDGRFERGATPPGPPLVRGGTSADPKGSPLIETGAEVGGVLDVQMTSLVLDERLRDRLPALLAKQFDELQPTGYADLNVRCVLGEDGRWDYQDLLFTARGCSVRPEKFPYPLSGLTGTVRQQDGRLIVAMEGRAGNRFVSVEGEIRNPGPLAEVLLDLKVGGLVLDHRFADACPPAARQTLEHLNFKGLADAHVRLHRPPGFARRMEVELAARLHEASVEPVSFPWRVTGLTGIVRYNSQRRLWSFEDCVGSHGTASVEGRGSFDFHTAPGLMQLAARVRGGHLDGQLEEALPQSLQHLWAELSPRGLADVALDVTWSPGLPVNVAVREAIVSEGGLRLRSFPYVLERVRAHLAYHDGRVDIRSFSGWHDQTCVRAGGYALVEPRGAWQLRLTELHVDDLPLDRNFRDTLPPDLRALVETIDHRGPPVSLKGTLHLRSSGEPAHVLTAGWDVETLLAGGRITTGLDLKEPHGRVHLRGTWDGVTVETDGSVDLESVYVLDYQLTHVRGPFRVVGDQVSIGSARALFPPDPADPSAAVPLGEQLTARAIGGVFTLNGRASLEAETLYQLRITLADGKLEEYARRYLPGVKDVRGVMTGGLALLGRGSNTDQLSGRGRLQVSPAALYELPIMAQIFQSLSALVPPDKTAFKYADLDFDIGSSQFLFQRIDLVGDAISLRGQGFVRFDGKVQLDFYSMMPRTRLPVALIPGFNEIVGEATKGWVGVEVRGKTSAPEARVKPVPALDDAMRSFLRAFESGPPGSAPRLLLPTFPQLRPAPVPDVRRPPLASRPRRW